MLSITARNRNQTDDLYSSQIVPGKGYHIFAGKDASKGLGMSSLKPEDAVSDYSSLDEKQLKVLDDWVCKRGS